MVTISRVQLLDGASTADGFLVAKLDTLHVIDYGMR
jgi:hypothetical protein